MHFISEVRRIPLPLYLILKAGISNDRYPRLARSRGVRRLLITSPCAQGSDLGGGWQEGAPIFGESARETHPPAPLAIMAAPTLTFLISPSHSGASGFSELWSVSSQNESSIDCPHNTVNQRLRHLYLYYITPGLIIKSHLFDNFIQGLGSNLSSLCIGERSAVSPSY